MFAAVVGSCGGSSYEYLTPLETGDGWETASLSEVGLKAEPFERLMTHIEDNPDRAVHGILVVREDKLVLEEYFDGYRFAYEDPEFRGEPIEFDATTRHNLMSVTKAVTGAIVGIAIDDGLIASVDDEVLDDFPEYASLADEATDRITVEHLLTMTSGLQWNEWDVPLTDTDRNDLIQLFIVDDPIEYILTKPVSHEPGIFWYYSGGDVNLLGEFFERATGTPIDEFSQTQFFDPLGITDYQWHYINSEIVYASGELEMRPRDLAKFGSLYLNDGQWNGTEVLPAWWVEESIDEKVSMPGRAADGDGYGYQWFTDTYEHESQTIDAAIRTGWGGQALVLFPTLDTLIVVTGGDYLQRSQVSELIEQHVLPAVNQ
ncbi:MAG: serine hydrolase domain-containing protein [Acidimicrobiales bacterium]